ncbi:hypothetical protein [Blautia sp.]|uniref:hypothetical protein n=1 Tax=Blautia sp. TaxID=1955243 RepID=UPI00257EC396|nr:hypothetical protein [Blautia sp.]MBS7174252.1 hypothetical protein [Blautia sp.]
MTGILYLILGSLCGKELAEIFVGQKKTGKNNRIWLALPGAFGVGMLAFGWVTYLIAWAASAAGADKPLIYGNLLTMAAGAVFLLGIYIQRYRKNKRIFTDKGLVEDKQLFWKELIFFSVLFVFLTWIIFYVFYIKDGILYSGFTVFGDYAPHTAMMRSFSLQNNFPTQYPHFGGQDVKYHFMFQFLVGNLEFLGLRLDIAYNAASILALLGFLMLLYSIARRVVGSGKAGVLTVLFFFFRSALTFFQFLWEHLRAGNLLQVLQENTSFIGYTTNEDWGLWNFNVYLNQRHLAFGLLIVALAVWMYLDWAEQGCRHKEKGLVWFRNRIFSKDAWKCRYVENALAAGLLIGMTSFWNGAAVIGGLLILMGFAVCSDGKLDYLITAVTAVGFSVLQTRLFMNGSSVEAAFQWGFISEDKSAGGVLWYLIQMSGIFFTGALILFFFYKKRLQRAVLVSCLFPLVFAFCFSLTPDITVNHKYIMISYAFLAMFWAGAVCLLFRKKWQGRILAAVLTVCLTITGIYDFVIIVRDNGPGHRVTVNTNSSLTDWLAQNLDSRDLILTPEYSISEVTMAGVMMYLGWPYYAWSAGYDTYDRAEKAKEIYTSQEPERVKSLVRQEGITYILFEEGMTFEGETCIETTIKSVYRLVYQSEDRRIRIYET